MTGQLASKIARMVDGRPLPVSPVPVALPDDDDPVSAALDHLGYAEGQSFAIEYVDSSRRASTRRITVWGIVGSAGGVPSLLAFCHERKARRQFRIDRIQCFIDYDGEVHSDIPRFLFDNFGMSLEIAAGRDRDEREQRWKHILEAVREEAVILAALARSDGHAVAEEVEIATDYLGRLSEANGMMLDEAEIAGIYRYANRLRPTEEAIRRALNGIANLPPRHLQRLLLTAVALIDADGKRHDAEVSLVNEIAMELTGMAVV